MFEMRISDMDRASIGRQKPLRFSEQQLEYLKTGEAPGTYSRSNIESQVQEQLQFLPARIEFLLEDLALFNEARKRGVVSFESWREPWLRVMGVGNEPSEQEIKEAYEFAIEGGAYPSSGLIQFGAQLGKIADNFHIPQDGDSLFKEKEQIILGVVQGICESMNIQAEGMSGELRRRFVEDLTDELEEWKEEMAAVDDELADEFENKASQSEEKTRRAKERIQQILEEAEISPIPLPESVLGKLEEREVIEELDRTGQVPADFRVEEVLSTERVLNIVKEERLSEKKQVAQRAEQEVERLSEEQITIGEASLNDGVTSYVKAIPVIRAIWESDKHTLTSEDILERLDKNSFVTPDAIVAEIDQCQYDELVLNPGEKEQLLLTEQDGEWHLTAYGKVVAVYIPLLLRRVHAKTRPQSFESVIEAAIDELENK